MDYDYLGETVEDILAVIEIKLKNGFAGSNTIYNDYEKLKCYAQKLGVSAKLYMATIWEYEDEPTTWERKNAAWAKGRLTELNASYVRGSDHEMRFYVCPHKYQYFQWSLICRGQHVGLSMKIEYISEILGIF